VVTANKAAIATHGRALSALAASRGVRLLDGGCVGGAAPVLERVEALAGAIVGFEGVLSGTANFVLDAIAHGAAPDDAVRRAQELGLAEADPSFDLSGADAAQKTAIVCRGAFGVDIDPGDIPTEGIFSPCGGDTEPPGDCGVRIRLVAEARPDPGGGITARVRRRALPAAHPLARVRGAGNAIRFDLSDGTSRLVKGTGAGRWPTTEAVLGDLLALRRPARPRRTPLEVA
jgi:homoserine dehydrogenase